MKTEHSIGQMKGKIALITGANKGIGREVSRQLADLGATVLMGARDSQRGKIAAETLKEEGFDVHLIQLEVTDKESIRKAVSEIDSRFKKLDILVNNAGIGMDNAPPSKLEEARLRQTFETNFFGVFLVTQGMLPLMRRSTAGRIVNMSSGLGSSNLNCDPDYEFDWCNYLAYNTSKSALNALTIQFAKELKETPIKVNSADPGFCATDINKHTGTRTVTQGAKIVVRLATLESDGPSGGFFNDNGPVPW